MGRARVHGRVRRHRHGVRVRLLVVVQLRRVRVGVRVRDRRARVRVRVHNRRVRVRVRVRDRRAARGRSGWGRRGGEAEVGETGRGRGCRRLPPRLSAQKRTFGHVRTRR